MSTWSHPKPLADWMREDSAILSLRGARPADAMDVARVHVRSWQAGYAGLLPEDLLQRLRPEDRAPRYAFGRSPDDGPTTIVSVRDEVICGFATTGSARGGGDTSLGELLALYVDPGFWRMGVGRHLVAAARRQLSGRGFTEAMLWVLVGNRQAEAFYRADGWAPDGARRTDEVWGVTLDELRYRRALS